MALFAFCAPYARRGSNGNTRLVVRPCALVDCLTQERAERELERLRADGTLAFVPPEAPISVRQASRREVAAYERFMRVRPASGPPPRDGALAARGRRMTLAFYEKLWRGEIDLDP